MFIKHYLKAILFLALFAVTVGFVLPFLISQPSDSAVVCGLGMIALLPIILSLSYRAVTSFINTVITKKENENESL